MRPEPRGEFNTRKIVLIADPGLPERLTRGISDLLCRILLQQVDSAVEWQVEIRVEVLSLDDNGEIRLMTRADDLREEQEPDYVIYLTDLPRRIGSHPVIYQIDMERAAALVSLPSLGAFRVRNRTINALTDVVIEMTSGRRDSPHQLVPRSRSRYTPPTRHEPHDSSHGPYLVLVGLRGRLRLLFGMVRCNRPVRLLQAMSNAIAAAIATGAFGIFYASIWDLADASSFWRLGVISGMAVCMLTAWLIGRNGLWDHPDGSVFGMRGHPGLDNLSTTATVMLSVTVLYLLLFLVLSVAAAIAVPPAYLGVQLGHPVDVSDYAQLSWLASSLGTFAGALGSNFDSDESIRAATYGRRENERRHL